VVGNYLYHSWEIEQVTEDSIAWLMRSPIDHAQWDTVFTIHRENGYSVNIEPPVLWMSPVGDSVLIFQNRSLNFTLLKSRVDLLAFNLTTKTLNWRINDFVNTGESTSNAPIIHNNQCIFMGDKTVYSVNLLNGQKQWEYTVSGDPGLNNLATASCIVVNNKIYLKTTGGLFSSLDAITGQLIWKNDDAGFNPSQLIFYKNKLYYMADHKIYCVDATNGKVLYTLASPNENRIDQRGILYEGGLVIDPSTNLMYFADSYYATCIKVPE
jgi:outer membrane protein assembly factor BamB